MFGRGGLFLGLLLTVDLVSANIATIYGFDSTPIVGFNMNLSCNTTMAAAVTPVTIVWLQDGSTIISGSSTSTVGTVTTSYISIPITSRGMAGASITCQISNGVIQHEDIEFISDVRSRPVVGAILPVNGASFFDEGTTGSWNINVNGAYPSITEQRCYINNNEISIPQPTQTVNTADSTYNFVITIERSLSAADHGLTIRCTIKHDTFPEPDNLVTRTAVMLVRHQPGQPSISTSFGTSGVNEFSNIHGNCSSVGGYPTPTVVWTGPANMVFSVPAQQANVVSSRFDITAVVGLIGETFTCTVSNAMGTYSASTTLSQVYVPPGPVTIDGFSTQIIEGQTMSINCTSRGALPRASVHWYLPDNTTDRSFSSQENSTTTTTVNTHDYTANFRDNGKTFTCNASNLMGSEYFTTAPITVYVQPQAVLMTGPNVAYQGIAINYTCEAPESFPASNLHWHGFSTDVVQQYFPSTISPNTDGTFKTVTGMTILPNAANNILNITCEARHTSTTTYSLSNTIIVTVHMKPAVTLTTASNENVRITSDYSIDYTVLSTVNFNVTWWHESPVGSGIRSQVMHDGIKYFIFLKSATVTTLTIRNYQTTDDGGYYVTAANHAGLSAIPVGSNVAQTTGYAIPNTPEIITFNSFPTENSVVLMNCTSTGGVPSAEVIWYYNNTEIDRSYTTGNSVSYNSYIHQTSFADKGATFKCEASNRFGNVSATRTFVDVYVTPVPTVIQSAVIWDQTNAIASYYEGQTYTINGTVPRFNPKTAAFGWSIDNQNLSPNHVVESITTEGVHAYTSTIDVPMTENLDGKQVTFSVQHLETTSSAVSFTISILYKPRVSFSQTSGQVQQGQNYAVTCDVTSSLPFNITWTIQGSNTQLVNGNKYQISGANGRTLTIINADFSDSLTYVCSSINSAGSGTAAEFYLIVYREVGQPLMNGFNKSAVDGTTVSVSCNSSGGVPPATISWQKNGVPLVVPTPTYGNDASNPVYSIITFVVNFNDDRNAVFKCTAANAYSSISDEKSFQDVYIFSNTITMSGTQPTTVTAGTPYTFYSETSGIYPAPRVFWFINNVRQFNGIIYNLNYTSNTYGIDSSFVFTPSRTDNGHQVTCVFDHSLETGLSINASRTLNVQFPTDPPSIDGYNFSVLEFTQQSLLCTVSGGNPRPEVRWYKNNTLIPGTSNTEITDGQGNLVTLNRYNFTVTQADSFAVYTCRSQHVVRNLSQSVTLGHVLASPSNIILTLPSESLTANQPIIGGSPNLLVGRSYEFRAEVGRAWPAPAIDWRVGNTFPANHSSVSTDNTDGTVRTISTLYYAPSLADNGQDLALLVYHDRTSATPVTQTATLVTHGTPLVAITPDSADIIINNNFMARCNVTSSLNSYSVMWYKGSAEIFSGGRISLSGDFLTISSVQFDDNGAYRCTATNAAGTAIQSNAITLSVISQGGQPAISGYVSTPNENDVLTLRCTSAGGVPTPTVSWFKDGVNVNVGDSMSIENGVIYKTSTWTYQVAYADRNANFSCLVSNSVANLTSSRVFSAVYIPPASVPNAVTGPTTTTAGFQTTFSINFPRVNPAPLVSWAIGGVALPSNVPPVVSLPTTEGALNATASVTFTQKAEYNTKALVATVTQPQSGAVFDVSATLTVKSQPSLPVVAGFPIDSTSIVGNSHTLVCTSVGGFPAPTLRWYRNGIPVQINYNTDFTSDPIVTTVSYSMAVTLAEENVVYRCTAENEIRTLSTDVTLADVYVKTSVSISGSSDVIAGKNSSMSCATSASHPQPSVEWEMVDQSDAVTSLPVKADLVGQPDGNGLVSVTSTVYFFPALADNRKTIRCVAAQSAISHSETDSLSITVHGPPSVAAASDKNVTLGVSVDLSCAVTSSLTSYNVSWYKQDQTGQTPVPIQTNSKYALVDANPYRLWIHSIDVNDTGRYYCIAQSAAGASAPSEVSVTVYTAPSTPTFANGVTTVTVTENQGGITATCLATVYPANTASYNWQFSPADGSSSRTEVPDTYFNRNQLNIPSAGRAQAGTYYCQAFNSYGTAEASFTADVQYRPELATNAKTSHPDATVEDLVVLSCDVVANPPSGITYVWTHQNQIVGSSANLEVNVKTGENAYTCVATNSVGNSEGLIFTIVAPTQDSGASTGASTADEGGLSGGIIAAIVLGVIFIILILIICCVGCKYYKDKKADEKTMRTTKKSKSKHKPSSVVPDIDDRRSTLYPKSKDPTLLFGPARTHEQRHYPRDISYIERDYSQRAPYDHTYYIPAPGSEMDDMSVYRETGFRSHRRKMPMVLPPLERVGGDYTGEAKRRKDRRKKNKKKRAQERQSGEGMENPGRSKDNSPPINLDDNQPEKDANTDTNVLLGDQFKN